MALQDSLEVSRMSACLGHAADEGNQRVMGGQPAGPVASSIIYVLYINLVCACPSQPKFDDGFTGTAVYTVVSCTFWFR